MHTWSIRMLCYNEAGTLPAVVRQPLGVLRRLTDSFEQLILDDSTTDASRESGTPLQQQNPALRIILQERNTRTAKVLQAMYGNAQYKNINNALGDGHFNAARFLLLKEIPASSFLPLIDMTMASVLPSAPYFPSPIHSLPSCWSDLRLRAWHTP